MSQNEEGGHLTFYFDVTSPNSYIAASRLHDVTKFTRSNVVWKPVVEQDLAKRAAQVAADGDNGLSVSVGEGKAAHLLDTDSGTPCANQGAIPLMEIPQFEKLMVTDFQRELKRYGLPNHSENQSPINDGKTDFTNAAILLCAFPDQYRPMLADALFKAYYVDNKSITSPVSLLTIARSLKLTSLPSASHVGSFSMNPQLPFALDESVFTNPEYSQRLEENIEEALNHGAFTTPSFWIDGVNKLFVGQDRIVLVEAELFSIRKKKPVGSIRRLERLHPRCLRTPPENRVRHLVFWFDLMSPWSFLGWSQLERLKREAGNGLKIELKPFSLAWIYKKLGHVTDSLMVGHELKRRYLRFDLEAWSSYWTGVNGQEIPALGPVDIKFPHEYPVDSTLALKVVLIYPKTLDAIFTATWRDNAKISDPAVLKNILNQAGFHGDDIVDNVISGPDSSIADSLLESNNQKAFDLGIVAAPVYEFGNYLVFGHSRLNVVTDLVLGWKPETSKLKASVAAFPHFDYRL